MLMEGKEMDLGYSVPGLGRFRVNLFLSQGEVRGVFRHVPERIPAFEESAPAQGARAPLPWSGAG